MPSLCRKPCRARRTKTPATTCGRDVGLLALRLAAGSLLFAHGTQKLFGWFGGAGPQGTGAAMEQMGYKPGVPSAVAAGLGETCGGTLLALGLATPAGGAAAAGVMAGATAFHAPNGPFASNGGFELPVLAGSVAVGLGLTGPGRLSLDHLTGHRLDRPWVAALAYPCVAVVAAALITRRARGGADRGPGGEEPQNQPSAS
ncbi:DoxX family protein [Streptomyces sp. RB6PN25]|uniref:DoxX family protein n=1 Tax=Streptomyces humicola TaxID=2953240 RepID=A0ABT1PWR5_9ACTN|nr:DoxX family protein [Streptomyces humicola]MCQ4081445.1 DoxX family protein [Streptomyces humicola]